MCRFIRYLRTQISARSSAVTILIPRQPDTKGRTAAVQGTSGDLARSLPDKLRIRAQILTREPLCGHVQIVFLPKRSQQRHHRTRVMGVNGSLVTPTVGQEDRLRRTRSQGLIPRSGCPWKTAGWPGRTKAHTWDTDESPAKNRSRTCRILRLRCGTPESVWTDPVHRDCRP